MLCGPLTDSGCTYAGYFTSAVTPEVKAERGSSDLRVEQSLEMGVEWSSDSKSRAGWSSDLGVGWNLEQQKCEMGCPLTLCILGDRWNKSSLSNRQWVQRDNDIPQLYQSGED